MPLVATVLVGLLVSSVLYYISWKVGEKDSNSFEKLSPYECGFEPVKSARTPFSLRFYTICILFVILEVEACLLIPLVLLVKGGYILYSLCGIVGFLLVLLVGLLYEWSMGALEWV